jgi:hypothetical protein
MRGDRQQSLEKKVWPVGCHKGEGFLAYLSSYQVFKKEFCFMIFYTYVSFNFSHLFIKRHVGLCPCEEVLLRVKEQRNILHEISKWNANCIGHILCRNCPLQQVIEGKIKGVIEMTERRGRKRRKLLAELKERRGCSHSKEEDLDRTLWRAHFGRGFGPVVRQSTK